MGLRPLLATVFLLFALLVVNSAYLGGISLLEFWQGRAYQDAFYLGMFLAHLVLGLLLVLPFLAFGLAHMRKALRVPNRYAVRIGIALFATGLVLLVTGIFLTRFGFLEINDPAIRTPAYWLHVVTPFVVAWLFVLHRLAGPRIHWGAGLGWGGAALSLSLVMVLFKFWPQEMMPPAAAVDHYPFAPALSRIETDGPIPAGHLMQNEVCEECHADIARQWQASIHRFSSFNNPAYRLSIDEAREVLLQRDGNVEASRFCAACHDPVLLFAGRFDDPRHDFDADPAASAGITCTSCHAITDVPGTRGNGEYTIADPARYPFADSGPGLLRAVNRQLIKARPAFHKNTFLNPVHRSAEFCSACHKVHLPEALNGYRWLRGQNHYDSFLQSGVSGHRIDSFYYPPKAKQRCSSCHMPLVASDDPAAQDFDGAGRRQVHDHRFLAANTGVPHMLGLPEEMVADRLALLKDVARVDIFAIREDGEVDGRLHAPLDSALPVLQPGGRYLVETVVRVTRVGHLMTQGTADSNEVWLDVSVREGGRVTGRSGGMDGEGRVDPWSWFGNAYVLDRDGRRIDRRNAQDIFVTLYNHQVPPGGAAVVRYMLEVPADARGPVTISAALRYRKFDADFMRYVQGDAYEGNTLPVAVIATDEVTLAVAGPAREAGGGRDDVAEWERWNDYGIGLLRQGKGKGALRQAAEAFAQVEALGRGDGALNLARVYYREGRLDEAAAALQRAAAAPVPAVPWTIAWFTALVDRENGHLEEATRTLEAIAATRFADARQRLFDFGYDVRVLNTLGRTYYERARGARGAQRREERLQLLHSARAWFAKTLAIDIEDLAAHYNLALVYEELGDEVAAERHRRLHEKYRPDEHAVARAASLHRRLNPAADHAASELTIYDLQRPGAAGMPLLTAGTGAGTRGGRDE